MPPKRPQSLSVQPLSSGVACSSQDDVTTCSQVSDEPVYDPPCEIVAGLWLGSARANNFECLNEQGFTCVVNTAKEISNCESEGSKGRKWLNLDFEDRCDEPISDSFGKTFKFINEALNQDQKVLVFCRRGVSRGATIVIHYIMESQKCSWSKAFELVKARRGCVNPNIGFLLQLQNADLTTASTVASSTPTD